MHSPVFQADERLTRRGKAGFLQASFLPADTHTDIPSCQESVHAAAVPFLRKAGKQAQFPAVALEQHFSDTHAQAGIAVQLIDLHKRTGASCGRMHDQEIGMGQFLLHTPEMV